MLYSLQINAILETLNKYNAVSMCPAVPYVSTPFIPAPPTRYGKMFLMAGMPLSNCGFSYGCVSGVSSVEKHSEAVETPPNFRIRILKIAFIVCVFFAWPHNSPCIDLHFIAAVYRHVDPFLRSIVCKIFRTFRNSKSSLSMRFLSSFEWSLDGIWIGWDQGATGTGLITSESLFCWHPAIHHARY